MSTNQIKVAIDCSKIAVGMCSNSKSESDIFDVLEDIFCCPPQIKKRRCVQRDETGEKYRTYYVDGTERWNQIEYLITLRFEYTVPCIEEYKLYKIERKDDDFDPVLIDADLSDVKLDSDIYDKYDNDEEFRDSYEENDVKVLLWDELVEKID